ncbi:hypothetical protein QN410_16645 [Pseudomonas sp. Bout1]|nr:hypothetical protein [Pseudomonas sp. Bout1]
MAKFEIFIRPVYVDYPWRTHSTRTGNVMGLPLQRLFLHEVATRDGFQNEALTLHFHNSRRMALANTLELRP